MIVLICKSCEYEFEKTRVLTMSDGTLKDKDHKHIKCENCQGSEIEKQQVEFRGAPMLGSFSTQTHRRKRNRKQKTGK